jgi:chemotaxis protein MotB
MLAAELGKLPNKVSIEGHTDAKPFSTSGTYTNWELSADRANAARRVMQENGLGPAQVTQVRGYADQRLRKADDPENPCNRRISVIVQYVIKPHTYDEEDKPAPKAGEKAAEKPAPSEHR